MVDYNGRWIDFWGNQLWRRVVDVAWSPVTANEASWPLQKLVSKVRGRITGITVKVDLSEQSLKKNFVFSAKWQFLA